MIRRLFGLAERDLHTAPCGAHAFAGYFPDLFQCGRFDIQRQQCGADTLAHGMAAGLCQCQCDLFLRDAQGIEIYRYRVTESDRAGLVEQHIIGFRQAFQRAAILDHHAFAQQRSGGHDLCRRHREPQRAGTGDDQHCDCNQQRLMPAGAREHPEHKGQQSKTMDCRCIEAGSAIGDAHIEGAALTGVVHQPGDIGDAGVFPGGRDPHDDRR